MTVLFEIFKWSRTRPDWQRDALRRLVQKGELSVDDIETLVENCKATHGLAKKQKVVPLTQDHIPENPTVEPTSLMSISHHQGVNALAEDQTLKFAPNLTVVYGDNAAGKTGYIRILKNACRARGQEIILGNVMLDTAPLPAEVTIKYQVGSMSGTKEWIGQGEDKFISQVSVFDAKCATVYLTEKTEVAFRPFGLDLFDKLVRACKAIRERLEIEQLHLRSNAIETVKAKIPEGTAVAELLDNITLLTKPEVVQKLSILSKEEKSHHEVLKKSHLDLQTNEPDRLIQQLRLHLRRVQALAQHIKEIEETLSVKAVKGVFRFRTEIHRKNAEADEVRRVTSQVGILDGTGSKIWTEFWESARNFSQQYPYPDQPFPVVDNDAHCVLCQQTLDDAARHRLEQFESFVNSSVEQELKQARESFSQMKKTFTDLKVMTDFINEILREISIDHEAVSDTITTALTKAEARRKSVVFALSKKQGLAEGCATLMSVTDVVDDLSDQISERIRNLNNSTTGDTPKLITTELRELRARELLAKHEQIVLDEIDRKKKSAAYGHCINDTQTQAITRKSTIVTRQAVTKKLVQSFKEELSNLYFRHVNVEIQEAGGSEGVLYHKLVLSRSPLVELPKVASEGEQRCLSIAAFFAELSTTDNLSSIVFDDPVSSLDYKWRERVSQRLVKEAKTRQVIVFTHDVVFLLYLQQNAKENGVAQHDQYIRQLSTKGSGVCVGELPWVALKVSGRIGYLNKLLQEAEKLYRQGHQTAYESKSSDIYSLLRETWERGIEEVLLNCVVERYRPSVQTRQIVSIADITATDCRTVESAMTKCSTWMKGHDQAPAARADMPPPSDIREDIDALNQWAKTIRKRREKSKN